MKDIIQEEMSTKKNFSRQASSFSFTSSLSSSVSRGSSASWSSILARRNFTSLILKISSLSRISPQRRQYLNFTSTLLSASWALFTSSRFLYFLSGLYSIPGFHHQLVRLFTSRMGIPRYHSRPMLPTHVDPDCFFRKGFN